MERMKKRVGIITVAIMFPIIGRMIGQYQIQSQYKSENQFNQLTEYENIRRTQELKDIYEECREYMGQYTLDFKEHNETDLMDGSGNIIMKSVIAFNNINFAYYLISNVNGSYIFNVEKSELSPFYEEAYLVYIQEENARTSAIAYKQFKTGKTWNLQTRDTLYKDFEIDVDKIWDYTYFDISSGTPKVVK